MGIRECIAGNHYTIKKGFIMCERMFVLGMEQLQVMGSCGGTEKLTSVVGWISRVHLPLSRPQWDLRNAHQASALTNCTWTKPLSLTETLSVPRTNRCKVRTCLLTNSLGNFFLTQITTQVK